MLGRKLYQDKGWYLMGLRWEEVLKGLPQDLLIKFNKMNQTGKQYTVNRILGFSKVDSIRAAGSNAKEGHSLSGTAQSLEERNPQIQEIVDYAQQNNLEAQLMNDKSAFAKTIEEKKNELQMQQLNQATSVMSPNMAESVDFYRKVVSGNIKSKKTIVSYDAQGKEIGRKTEYIEDVGSKMQAREKLDRLLGINAIQNLGQVQVGSISINIVDASKKEPDEEREVDIQNDAIIRDETIIEQEPERVVEEEKPKPQPKKEEPFDYDKAYQEMLKKREQRKAKQQAKKEQA